MKALKRVFAIVIFLAPAIVGGVGYMLDGNSPFDAFYLSASMYLFNASTTGNNFLVEISRWIAPVMTASGVVLLLKEIWTRVKEYFIGLNSDAVAVYGSKTLFELVAKNVKHVVYSKTGEIKDVKIHYILFDNEDEGLRFYMKNREQLLHKEVYLKLDAVDSLQASIDNVHFFNVSEIMARTFWKEHPLEEVFEKRP